MTADEFRTLRRSQGWTQAEMAALMEVSPMTVSRWETGTHKVSPSEAFHVRALAGQATKRTGKNKVETQEYRP